MTSDETLLLQALKLKQLGTTGHSLDSDVTERLLDQHPEEMKEKMRNICAFVSISMFEEVANVCEVLSLSKRQFVEMALVDLLAKSHKILRDTEALKSFEVS